MAAITFGIQDVSTKRAVAELQRQIDALKKKNPAAATVRSASVDLSGIETTIQNLQTSIGTLQTNVGTLQTNVGTLQNNMVSLRLASASDFGINPTGHMVWTFTLSSGESIIGLATFNLGSFNGTIGHLTFGGNKITLAVSTTGSPGIDSISALVMKVGA